MFCNENDPPPKLGFEIPSFRGDFVCENNFYIFDEYRKENI